MSQLPVVALVEDDDAVRRSTAGLLERAGYRVRTYASGNAFLAARLPADLGCVLLDMRMPGKDGMAVLRELEGRPSRAPVLVLTGHGDVAMAVAAMKLGAVDFLEKPYPAKELLNAVRAAIETGTQSAEVAAIQQDAVARVKSLSQRQRQVLGGIMDGKLNKIIAYELGLSIRTIEAYRAQLLEKLGVRGTAEAVRLAMTASLDRSS